MNRMRKPKSINYGLDKSAMYWRAACCACALIIGASVAITDVKAQETERIVVLDPFTVIGSKDAAYFIPGSGYFIDDFEIQQHNYDNIEQLMRRVPGVYFRTEDGYGLFPNISFRGVGSMRTTKLTVMEDGILSAPAPYSAPAAYYIPTSGRMAALEILKGSSQVRFGPHTTGGVLNYISTPIPEAFGGRVRLSYGDDGDMRFHGHIGEVWTSDAGSLGVLFEHYFRQNDGFKTIDSSPTFGGGDTGFRRNEPMLKLSWTTASGPRQSFEVKVGYTDMVADQTYLGLAEADFRADPYRRYVASQFDVIPTEQWRSYFRHTIDFAERTKLATTIYYNSFARAWYKLNDVRRPGGQSSGLSQALAGGPFVDASGPVAGTEGEPLRVIRGEAAGTWRVRDNNREYRSYGIESVLHHTMEFAGATHDFEAGIRFHKDYEDRFQKDDDYEVDNLGNVIGTTIRARGTQENRRGLARAFSAHVSDQISWSRFTLTPGLRYERVTYTDERRGMDPTLPDFNTVIRSDRGTVDVFAPGIAARYDISNRWTAFAGVHRGISLPGTGVARDPSIGPETSIGIEAGGRYRSDDQAVRAEVVLFHTDFSNLIVPANIGGAGTGRTENAGDVRAYGAEVLLGFDPGTRLGWSFAVPLQLAYTYTNATIQSDVNASGSSGGSVESIFAGARKGNRLPYMPTHQLSVSAGIEFEKLGIHLDGFYVPATYASANNSAAEINPVGGPGNTPQPDARFGRNDAYFILDLSVSYQINDSLTLNAGVQNVLDREYIASRLPHGPRPGHPRFASVGLTYDF